MYVLGNKKILNNKGIAIVGTRDCTKYGKNISFKFSKELTQKGFNIISGLALGIDTYAHLGTVQINMENSKSIGKTIAVLGCGIDELYPKQNKILAKQILKTGGCIISEYPNGTKPNKANFPQRNRIISGLSNEGVIVVEASKKSGSLITVDYAQEQHKKILAVPGSIFNETSAGCNSLIYDGCDPFLGKQDLYDFLNIIKKGGENNNKNDIKMDLLKKIGKEPIHIDKIIGSVNIDRTALFELLFEMQNENEIICLPGNYYVKIR